MTPKEKALDIIKKMGMVTLNDPDFNNGYMLPFHVAVGCARVMVSELIKEEIMWQNGEPDPKDYWRKVIAELQLLNP